MFATNHFKIFHISISYVTSRKANTISIVISKRALWTGTQKIVHVSYITKHPNKLRLHILEMKSSSLK
jgi:hypothetical protein